MSGNRFGVPYGPEEDAIVREAYPQGGSAGAVRALAAAGFAGRTRESVKSRARTLGLVADPRHDTLPKFIAFRVDEEWVRMLDGKRGRTSRSEFIRQAVRNA